MNLIAALLQLTKVAETQTLWSQALNDPQFADHVQLSSR
jgi:hypothetical protein